MSFKYLITSVGSFSSVLYHPLAHLTAFGTPCCKLMTLGFLTPDPHLNRNQPRVQQRKHPTVGGFGHFLSPGPLATLPARWQGEKDWGRDILYVGLLLPAARLSHTADCSSTLQKMSDNLYCAMYRSASLIKKIIIKQLNSFMVGS